MKRLIFIFLTLVMLLSLCACTADPQVGNPDDTLPTKPACQHSWLEATCTEPKTCALCGEKEGSSVGHDWDAGICKTCEAADPGFNPLTSGTWLYLTKEEWKILDFHPDGTCDIKNVQGMPQYAKTVEECVDAAVANLKRQHKDNWESYASRYYVLQVGNYYYAANMNMTTSEYTASGKDIVIEQEGFLPVYMTLVSRKSLEDAVEGRKYINLQVQFGPNLLKQYTRIYGN